MTAQQDLLQINLNNYGPYSELIRNGFMEVWTKDINKDNLRYHFMCVLNIFRDGIDRIEVHRMKIRIIFEDNVDVTVSIFEYFVNLIFWLAPLLADNKLTCRFFFWVENFTADDIKEYIDNNYLDIHRTDYDNMTMNNVIDDVLEMFKANDEFALYYMNTINNEDTIRLMNQNPEFYKCIHADLSGIPLENVKDVGTKITNEAIKYIMDSDHCLGDPFRAKEGINRKQFREYQVNVGTTVDGEGGIYPSITNTSFANEGVRKIDDYWKEASKGRQAQIINKENVGSSGAFARQLSLNNRETILNPNEHLSCRTKNLIQITIKNASYLNLFKNRYYRFTPNGVEYRISSNPIRDNKDLIGKTILLRSPMTCESNVFGHGICRKCYGDLYYTNRDVNIGQMASELLSSRLTQMLLSAKHLLESRIIKPVFTPLFYNYLELAHNIVKVKEGVDLEETFIVIDQDSVKTEDDNDNFDYNDYCTGFYLMTPDRNKTYIRLQSDDNLYLTDDMILRIDDRHLNDDGDYVISLSEMKDYNLFLINMNNDELSKTLKGVKSLLDKEDSIRDLTKEQFLEKLIDVVIEGGINIDAVHLELILSNQIRKYLTDKEDILDLPDWGIPNEKYTLITLNKALTNNPSVTVSLQYQYIKKLLVDPLTYKKTKPSSVDLIFQEQPQIYANMKPENKDHIKSDREVIYEPIKFVDNPNEKSL